MSHTTFARIKKMSMGVTIGKPLGMEKIWSGESPFSGEEFVLKAGDTMTGMLILPASDPTDPNHATRKQYVDDQITAVAVSIAGKVNKSGDSMSGFLTLHADPTLAFHAATKQYVDSFAATIANKVAKAGDTMSGLLTLSGPPTVDLHAATKKYVDDQVSGMAGPLAAQFVDVAGDTMTGMLTLPATTPTLANHATRKQYVDDLIATANSAINNKVSKTGDTMSNFLTLHADPTSNLHAATKAYVDTQITTVNTSLTGKVSKSGDTMTGMLTLSATNPTLADHATRKAYVDAADTALTTSVNAKVAKAGDSMTGQLTIDPGTALGSIGQFVKLNGNAFRFGHANVNYFGTLGTLSTQGHPFIGWHAEHSNVADSFENSGAGVAGFVAYHTGQGLSFWANGVATANAAFSSAKHILTLDWGTGKVNAPLGLVVGSSVLTGGSALNVYGNSSYSCDLNMLPAAGQNPRFDIYSSSSVLKARLICMETINQAFVVYSIGATASWFGSQNDVLTGILQGDISRLQFNSTRGTFTQTTNATTQSDGAVVINGGLSVLKSSIMGAIKINEDSGSWVSGLGAAFGMIIEHTGGASTYGLGMRVKTGTYPCNYHMYYNHTGTNIGRAGAVAGGGGFEWVSVSDIRLKPERLPYKDAFRVIDAIRVYDHSWRDNDIRGVGMAAQELYEVFPLAASPGNDLPVDAPGWVPWGSDYSKLVPVLVADAQETHRRLEEIEDWIDDFKRSKSKKKV